MIHSPENTTRPRSIAVKFCVALAILTLLLSSDLRADDPVLENGDILVGARGGSGFWGYYGLIWRIRDGNKQIILGDDPANRIGSRPTDFLIDSKGRLVFVATGALVTGNGNDTGLFRANLETGEVETLHVFRYAPNPDEPVPAAYPAGVVSAYTCMRTGLHATRVLQAVIDDDVKSGTPQFRYAEAYNLSAALTVGGERARVYAFRYLADEGKLERGISLEPLPPRGCGVDMVVKGSDTYYGLESWVGVAQASVTLDLKIEADTDFGSGVFSAALRLGGGSELIYSHKTILDDLDVENRRVAACGTTIEIPANAGGTFNVLAGVRNIGFLGDGLFATSHSGAAGFPYLLDLGGTYPFMNPNSCQIYQAVAHKSPFDYGTEESEATSAVAFGNRILATQDHRGRLLSLTREGTSVVVEEGFDRPDGVVAYPPEDVPITGALLVIRIDSPLNVLVTDAAGRRIGRTAAGGEVNDFGDKGGIVDPSGTGEPLFYAVMNPAPGSYSVESVGTGEGSYAITVYSADPSQSEAGMIRVTGTTSAGDVDSHDFVASDEGLALEFVAPPLPDDTIPPVTTATLSTAANAAGWHNSDVTVTLAAVDEEGGSGVSEIFYSTSIGAAVAGEVVTGSAASIAITGEGTTTLTFSARDQAGNEEAPQTLTIRIDKTPPTVSGVRLPAANGAGWNNTDVTVQFTCADDLSGVASCDPAIQEVSTEGAGQSRTASAVDQAGNSASGIVADINIDKTAPDVTCTPAPAMLWPPNHNLVSVSATVDVIDALSGAAGFVLLAATSNEADNGTGDGDLPNDIQEFDIGAADTSGLLRAERAGTGRGRLYLLSYQGADLADNVATCQGEVSVPHSRGKR